MTAPHERAEQRPLSEALWRLLVVIDRKSLPFPLAISPNVYGVGEELLRLQVEEPHFRQWLAVIDDHVLSTSEHDDAVHVTVAGTLSGGVRTQLVCVMSQQQSSDVEVHA